MKMERPTTHTEILTLWPSREALIGDLWPGDAITQARKDRVRKWTERNRIPPSEWDKLVIAGQLRGFAISHELFAQIARVQAA